MAVTVEELRRERALRLDEARRRSNPLLNYIEYTPLTVKKEEAKASSGGVVERGLATVADGFTSVREGIWQSLEGVVDFGAGLVGAIGGLFSDDFKDDVKDFIATDWVGDWFDNGIYDWEKENSYIDEGGFVDNTLESVGGMLPAVALNFVPFVGPLLSKAHIYMSSTGDAAENAYREGAGFYSGLGYGAVMGGVELATEKFVGKIGGNGFFDDIIPKSGIGRYVGTAIGEGAEEVAAELVDPAAKSIYKGKDAFDEYGSGEYWKGVGKAGLTGMAVSGVYGGAFDVMAGGVKAGDVKALLEDANATETKGINLQTIGKLDGTTREKLSSRTLSDFKQIESILKKLPEDRRAKIIKSYNLDGMFEADGNMNADFSKSLDGDGNLEYNKNYISYTARGSAQKIADTLSDMSADVAQKYAEQNNVDIETAKAQVGEFQLYNQELSENGNKTFTKFKKALSYLNKLGDSNVKFAVVEPNSSFNGALKDGVLYIGADTFENGKWAGTLVHEYMHFEEGTAEYDTLVKHLESDNALLGSALASVSGKAYGFDGTKLDAIIEKASSGEGITADDRRYYASFKGEVSAHMGEMLLGSETFIDTIVAKDGNLAQRAVARIKSLKAMFERLGNAEANAEYKFLKKAEDLYLKAAEKAGDARLIRYISSGELDEEEAKYARKAVNVKKLPKVKKYIKIGEYEYNVIYKKVTALYSGISDGFADGIAIEDGNSIYIVDSGKDNGKLDFGVREKLIRSDPNARAEHIRRINNDTISRGNVDDSIAGRIRSRSADNSDSVRRQGNRPQLQITQRESRHNESGVSSKNEEATKGIKYSFKGNSDNNKNTAFNNEKGQADNKKPNSYTKAEAEAMVDGIMKNLFVSDDYGGVWTSGELKNRAAVIKQAHAILNGAEAGKRFGEALKFADYIIEHTALVENVDGNILEPCIQTLDTLRPYLHKLNLDNLKGEIQHHYDKDRSVYSRWSKRKGEKGLGVDVMAMELEEQGYILSADHPADMLFEIDKAYKEAIDVIKKRTKAAVKESYSEAEIKELRQKIAQEIMNSFDERDFSLPKLKQIAESSSREAERLREENAKLRKEAYKATKTAERAIAEKNEAKEKAQKEKEQRIHAENYSKAANRVLKLVRDISNWKKGVFESAAEANGDVFKGIKGELTRIDIKGNVSPIAARKAMKKLADWYGAADLYPIVQELKEAEIWSEDALKAMQSIGDVKSIEAQKPLSVAELQNLETVIRHLKHIAETYHRIFRAGKYVDAKPLAEDYIRIIGENAKIKVGRVAKLIDGKYYEYFGDPEALMKWHDRYNEDGFFTATFNELREGSLNMAIAQMEMRAELDAWLDQNPNFLKKLNNTKIEVEGVEMTRAEALSLYMTARREHAEGGLAVGGFEVKDAKSGEKIGVDGLVDRKMASAENINAADKSKRPRHTRYSEDTLNENLKVVANMESVSHIDVSKLEKSGEAPSEIYAKFFESLGNEIYSQEYGYISLKKSSIKSEIRHGTTAEKIASIEAIPDVIKNGRVIFCKEKEAGVERLVISAPIKIGNVEYLMGVMLQRDAQNQRLYLHNVILNEKGSSTSKVDLLTTGTLDEDDRLFITSILQKVLSVKSEVKKTGDATYDMEKMIGLVGKLKDSLFEQFSESEKQYLDFVEKILNEDCKSRKERTDNIRLGYSNTLEGFYYPIRRGHVAYKVGEDTLGAELGRIKSLSFNKDTVKGSKGRLFIEPINEVVDRHVAGIAMYENLSIAIDNFNRLFNIDIGGNKNNPVTIAKAMEKEGGWAEAGKYIDKLIKDIEGIKSTDKWESKALGFIRSGFVKFQLGANPKTWVTQLSSLFASMSVLNPQHVAKAMAYTGTHSKAYAEDLDNHSALAKLRNSENTAALSQGVIEKLGRVGDFLMKPIGKTDRFVIKKLWYACQLQAEAEQKLKLGTEENKVAAAKLLEKVIFETQQNSLLTERSAAMRSSSELIKGFTMFSSDAMKMTARIVDAYGKICVIKDKLKTAEGEVKKGLEADLKKAVKEFRRASASAIATAVFMSVIALAFSHLYGKRDDDETLGEAAVTFGADFFGNILGGLPLIRDIYSYISDGYEMNHYALSSVNDLISGVNGLITLTGAWVSGKQITSQEIASKTKAALFGAGQLFGIPLRNAYNVGRGVFGLTGLITGNGKSFGYSWDSVFYDKNYRSDLNKAIEAGDDKLVETISSLIVGESFGGVDNAVADELRRLIATGADVLPRAVGDRITYDGDQYEFTLRQRSRFEDIYGTADEVLVDLVKLKQYKDADDATKAKAIKFIYDVYFELAIDDMLGVDSADKNVLFAEAIDIEKLAIIVAQARAITADIDKSGKVISGTKKKKVIDFIESLSLSAAQKHMILGYLGYKQSAGEDKVKAYVNRLKLTKAEKKALLEFSGYKVA